MDQILKKWIPEHKFQRALETAPAPAATPAVADTGSAGAAETPAKLSVAGLAIEGVNTVQGFENASGDEESYRYMLDSFCRDSAEKTNMLRHIQYHLKNAGDFQNVSETIMQHLAMILRTAKNSALSIGAEAVAAEAAALEKCLQAGDVQAMETALPGFCEHLQNVAGSVYKALG